MLTINVNNLRTGGNKRLRVACTLLEGIVADFLYNSQFFSEFLCYNIMFRSPKSKVQIPWRNHMIVEYVFHI